MKSTVYIDISDLVRSRSSTGIQRVLKEYLLRTLTQNHGIQYKVVYYDSIEKSLRMVADYEVLNLLHDLKVYEFKTSTTIDIKKMHQGGITFFFDMDSTWNSFIQRSVLYPQLKKQKIIIVNFIYDLIPCVRPQYVHDNTIRKFLYYLSAVYRYSDMVFLDSRSSENDFVSIKEQAGIQRHIPTRVVTLGSDFTKIRSNTKYSKKVKNVLEKKYILFVGTLEPRKNQSEVLDAFDILSKKYKDLNLVFIGKKGWKVEHLVSRIHKHPLKDKRFYWFDSVNDNLLGDFYKSAFLVVYLSEYEGYGLPVSESLKYGNVTITSNNSSLYEVGQDAADYISKGSLTELTELISLYLVNPVLYDFKKDYIKSNFFLKKWDLMFDSITNVFKKFELSLLHKKRSSLDVKMQAVFISIDLKKIQSTIKAVDRYMKFITEYIIVTKPQLVEVYKNKITTEKKVTVLDELSLLKEHKKTFHLKDHQSKNWLLRASLAYLDILEKQFIMLDDDNRPLISVESDYFISETGEYKAFYYNDLIHWNFKESEYDKGQQETGRILNEKGYELISYSSHMPQIINKKIFREAVEEFWQTGLAQPLDEWSIYFNYGVSNYPALFEKKIAETMNWPAMESDWEKKYKPKKFIFENYYDHIYQSGIFSGVSNLTVQKKIELKNKEIQPFDKTQELSDKMDEDCREQNMVHGVLSFANKNIELHLFNIPYMLSAATNSWLILKVNYKIIYKTEKDPQTVIYYIINGQEGYRTVLPQRKEEMKYQEGIIDLKILSKHLVNGVYDILFDVESDGKKVFSKESPYLSKLFMSSPQKD